MFHKCETAISWRQIFTTAAVGREIEAQARGADLVIVTHLVTLQSL